MFYSLPSLISWMLVVVSISILAFFLARMITTRRIITWVVSLCFGVITFASLWIFALASDPQTCLVSIIAPENSSEVRGTEVRLLGRVNPATCRVTAIVRSEKDIQWWVQEFFEDVSTDGSWSLKVQIGTSNKGKNETYEVIALASKNSVLFNLLTGRHLYKGLTIHSTPRWNQSKPITIYRAE